MVKLKRGGQLPLFLLTVLGFQLLCTGIVHGNDFGDSRPFNESPNVDSSNELHPPNDPGHESNSSSQQWSENGLHQSQNSVHQSNGSSQQWSENGFHQSLNSVHQSNGSSQLWSENGLHQPQNSVHQSRPFTQISGTVGVASPGLRPGTQRFGLGDGYFFHRQRASSGRVFLRCVSARSSVPCLARASMLEDYSDFILLGPHNHPPDQMHNRVVQLRNNLLEACRARPSVRIDVIYHEVCRNVQREVSSRVSLLSMRPSMVRAQSENRPNIPLDLMELHETLERNQDLAMSLDGEEVLYRGITGAVGHRSLVFMSNRIVEGIGPIRYLFGDATFYARPNNPHSAQLYTIVSLRDNHVIPLFHALMESRSEQAYRDLFQYFRQLAPNVDPEFIVTDFEVAQQQALRQVFPLARLTGCLWHYARAVCRNVRSLGLHAIVRDQENARRIVRLIIALPMVPARRMQEALNVIIIESRRLNLHNELLNLFHYVRHTWLDGVSADTLSVFGVRHRTNNVAECHHRNLNSRLVRRPNIWRFLDLLQETEDTAWRDLGRVEVGLAPSRARRTTSLLNDARVRSCSRQVIHGEMDLLHFLSAVSWHLDPTIRDMLREREVEDQPPSPQRGPAPIQELSLHDGNVNSQCPESDPDFQSQVFDPVASGMRHREPWLELDHHDLYEDLMERENVPPVRGRSGRGRARGRVRGGRTGRGRGRQPPAVQPCQPPTSLPPVRRPRQQSPPPSPPPVRRPRQQSPPPSPPPVRRPRQQSPPPSLPPVQLNQQQRPRRLDQPIFRNEEFSDAEPMEEECDEELRRYTECLICNARRGHYAMIGCGAYPICGTCIHQWFVRQGMNTCPHCGNPHPGWLRLDN